MQNGGVIVPRPRACALSSQNMDKTCPAVNSNMCFFQRTPCSNQESGLEFNGVIYNSQPHKLVIFQHVLQIGSGKPNL